MLAHQGQHQVEEHTKVAEINGWRVQWKNNGIDYPAIWQAHIKGELQVQHLSDGHDFRAVDIAEVNGQRYIIKRDWQVEKRIEKHFTCLLMGDTKYSRIFKLTSQAIRKGCQVVHDVVLVAEKLSGRTTCLEAYFIADYIEGASLTPLVFKNRMAEVVQTVLKMHDCGLACNDIHPGNFIMTQDNSFKIIDLDMSSPLFICQTNDIRSLRYRFKADVPLRGFLHHLLWGGYLLRDGLRYLWAKVRFQPAPVRK